MVRSDPRRPASARRTTTIDSTWPDGLRGETVMTLGARDIVTGGGDDGGLRTIDEASVEVRVDPAGTVTAVTTITGASDVGPLGQLARLVGANVRSGFGVLVMDVLADQLSRRGLVASLMEDLSGAFLVSGFVPLRAGLFGLDPDTARSLAALQGEVCTGWATGGPLHRVLAEEGRFAVPVGPAAPPLDRDDPAGWHGLPSLPPDHHRRARLLDLVRGEGSTLLLRSHFRDSARTDGPEEVLHEYAVEAEVGADDRIARVDVDPRVLPWQACPGAVASGQRVVGVALDELPRMIRAELVGTSTCTHLNSSLRALADARSLASALPAA